MHLHQSFCRSVITLSTSLFIAIAGNGQVQAAKIAIIDSGSNLPGVTGRDFVRGDNVPNDENRIQHGTTITQILNQYKPPRDMVALKVIGTDFNYNPATSEAALAAAADMGDVKVIDVSSSTPLSLSSLQDAAGRDKVIVMNSGNKAGGRPLGIAQLAPLLSGRAVVVGAVDSNNNLEPYSNRAGDLAEYFVVAPGSTNFSSTRGTSFAKPHASGILALLLWRFPNLSPQDAVNILFATADDIGAPGVDPVFGHGRVNREAALNPDGDISIPDSGGGGGSGAVIAGVAILGGAIAYALTRKKPLETTLVIDGWDRAYTMDLTKITQTRSDRGSLSGILKSLNTLEKTHMVNQSKESTAFLRVRQPTIENLPVYNPTSWLNDDRHFDPEPSMSFYQYSQHGSGYSFHINSGITHEFGALGLSSAPEDQISFLSNKIFSSPFLGYSSQGHASHLAHAFTQNSSVSVGVSRVDDQNQLGLRSDAAIFEFTHRQDRYALSASFGQLLEYGSMFGGSRGGPYNVDDTLTYSFGLSGTYRLAPEVQLIGNYTQGYSQIDAGNGGTLLSDFSGLRSDAWGMGLLFDNVAQERDRIGFAISQPLKVVHGGVTLAVPQSRSLDNVITGTTDRVDLGSGGRELAAETFYRMWVGDNTRFTTHLMHRRNPEHATDTASETSILGIFEYQL